MAKRKSTVPPVPGQRDIEKPGEAIKKVAKGFTMGKIKPVKPKLVIVGVEGWGKTSTGAFIPDATIMMAPTETGYLTLLDVKRVPEIPRAIADSWTGEDGAKELVKNYNAKTPLIIDEASGFEKMCHEYVCNKDFDSNWSKFYYYYRGVKESIPEWISFLKLLEDLDCMVILLSHCAVETFKDPTNDDHDRYVAALAKDTWGVTKRWADACLFGTFISTVDVDGKGTGGEDRILYTTHRDTHDAKNRYGMSPEIDMPNYPKQVWPVIWDKIQNPEMPIDEPGEEE